MADENLPELSDQGGMDIPQSSGGSGGIQGFFQDVINDPQKRLIAIIAAAVLVIVITIVAVSTGNKDENRGKPVTLVQELDQARAFEIVAKLKSVNIEAKVNPSEKPGEYVIEVYEQAVETAYLTLSRTNLLEDEGYGLFDDNDWAASDYDKRIKLTRAINGDLSRIISRMDGLHAATVRVNIPEQQLFTDFQNPPTATVQIELTDDGDEISKSQVKSIINVIRGYVPKIGDDNISIVDTQGRNYNTFRDEGESSTDDFIDEIEKVNKTIQKRIEKYLDVVLGDEKYKVSVSAFISREKVSKQQTLYSEGAVGSRQVGSEILDSGGKPVVGPVSGQQGKSYKHNTSTEQLLPSFEQQKVTYLPGRVTGVTVALAVDKSVPATISLKQLQESVAAIVGPNTLAEHIKLTVVDLRSADADLNSLAAAKKEDSGIWGWIVKIFSIVATIVGLLIVGIVGLNFLNAASTEETEVDPNLGSEFDQVLNENPDYGEAYNEEDYDLEGEDFGEQKALEQQEALLKEMLNDANDLEDAAGVTEKEAPKSYSSAATAQADKSEEKNVEFETLLNNFQSVASNKPDLLAKKIQVWLEEE